MTPETSVIQSRFIHLVDLIIKISPALIGISFVVSVSYDYYFLKALNLTFSDVPTQISDHIRSSILWIPILGGMYVSILQLIMMWDDRIWDSMTNDPSKLARGFFKLMPYLAPLIIIFQTIPMIFSNYTLAVYFTATIYIIKRKNVLYAEHKHTARIILLAMICVLFISIDGYRSARSLLNATNQHISAIIKINDKLESISINGVRRFSDFSIIIDTKKQVYILPKDSIIQITYNDPAEESKTLIEFLSGNLFGVNPPKKAASSP